MKKFLSIGLAATMLFNAGIPGSAEEASSDGNSSTSPVTISADAAAFNVTIPLSLPAHVNSVGIVTTADDTQIINKSSSQVKISAVAFEAQGDWTLAEYGADLSDVKIGTKTVGINIAGAVDAYENIELDYGICTSSDGSIIGDADVAFSVIPGATFDSDGNTEGTVMTLKYDATIPAQKDSISEDASETAANVIFTIEWDDGEAQPEPLVLSARAVVPEGATYYTGVTSETTGDYSGDSVTVYNAGDEMPELSKNDVFVMGDYEYRYKGYYTINIHNEDSWTLSSSSADGWGVRVLSTDKEEYGQMYTTINGEDVKTLHYTYWDCASMVEAPSISNAATKLLSTYEDCTALTTPASIPDGVTDLRSTFQGCTSLPKSPALPDSATLLSNIFEGCESLTVAPKLPSETIYLTNAFEGCKSLVRPPVIPDKVTSLKETFLNCTALKTAPEIPNNVTSTDSTFMGCTSLTTAPVVPEGVTAMQSMYEGCTALTTVPNIPSTAGSISSTFEGCTSLKNAPTIPEGVKNMYSAFRDCTALTRVDTIPSSVTDIRYAFQNCSSLTTPPTFPETIAANSLFSTFSGCTSLKTAPKIPSNATELYSTFQNCESLTEAPELPDGVTWMTHLFSGCSSLLAAPEIPNGVTSLSGSFNGCTNMVTGPSVIPNAVTNMYQAFKDCTLLTKAPAVPSAVTDVRYTYQNCTGLEADENGVISIEVNANPTQYNNFITGTNVTEITGATTMAAELLATK